MDYEGFMDGLDGRPLVRKVGNPPARSIGSQVVAAIKETLFPDDPLRRFKDQTAVTRWKLVIQYVFPIVEWGQNYSGKMLRGDIIAGLTIACLAIPQDLGYAKLAHLPPVHGLYSSFVPPLVYAAMGSSRHIAIGPVAVVSILLGTMLKDELDPSDPNYIRLAFTATFFAGVVQAALGVLRLGFIVDFLSHAAIVGFMAGAAATIGMQQLKGMFGIWDWRTVIIEMAFLYFLIITKVVAKKRKKLFWIAALAPLISIILSTVCVYASSADKHGVNIVGHIQKGANPSSVHEIFWTGKYLWRGFSIGIVAGLISLTEAVAIGRTFAALKDYNIDGNKEMISIGVMNMVGATTSCYVATGSFSRSAVNYQSGCHTAIANVVMSVVVLLTLLFLTPLFKYTPTAILSAIIIAAVVNLIEVRAAILIWKTDKVDFLVMIGTFFGVLFISVEYGLLIAVCISFGRILYHVTRPHTAVLGNILGTSIYRNFQQYPDAISEPGIIIVRIDASVYFANSSYICERILRYVDEEQEIINTSGRVPLEFVIIEMTPVMSIDTTAIHAFERLDVALKKRNIQVTFGNPGGEVIERFVSTGFFDHIGEENFFLSVGDAVRVLSIIIKRNSHKISTNNDDQV